jgi:hypothetical protein
VFVDRRKSHPPVCWKLATVARRTFCSTPALGGASFGEIFLYGNNT